ncbi:MAG: NAD-dependent epimerase/dehydratase family protein [Opitutaceae bacterium]
MNVLITGGAGFIGSHLAARLQGEHAVRVLDDLSTGRRENLAGLRVELIEGSITDRAAVSRAVRDVEVVFHLAAMVSVPESMQRPDVCVERNVTGLLNVLSAATEAKVRRLCFSSSAAVYGERPESPKREDLTPDPRSPYAITKLDGEYYCRLWSATTPLETVSLRYFNVFGPRQDPKSAYAAAVPIFLRQALASEPLTIFGDGGQTRDFISVHDVVAANLFAATTPGMAGVYNVGYGGEMTVLELAQRIIRATGSRSVIQHAPTRAGDVRHSRADVTRLLASGVRPTTSVDAALAELVTLARAAQ